MPLVYTNAGAWILSLISCMMGPGSTDNPFIESFNGSFRDECLNVNWFFSVEDAKEKFDHWREDYNGFRPHSSLEDMSPNEYIEKKENSSDFLLLTSS